MSYRAYITSAAGTTYVRTLTARSAGAAEARIYRKVPHAVLVTIERIGG